MMHLQSVASDLQFQEKELIIKYIFSKKNSDYLYVNAV